MKPHYATEREWLDAFRREQQAKDRPPTPARLERKFISGLELAGSPLKLHYGAPVRLRRFGRRAR